MLELLIERGADANLVCQGWKPLMSAASSWNERAMQVLLARGAEVSAQDAHACTALHQVVASRGP